MKTLTKTEEEGSISINRPDRSTYPEEKSVLRSGATPLHLFLDRDVHRSNAYWKVVGIEGC